MRAPAAARSRQGIADAIDGYASWLRAGGEIGSVVSRILQRISSPVVRWGHLHFFSVDPKTVPPPCARHAVSEASREEILAGLLDSSADDALQARLARGDRCLVARRNGEVIGRLWWTRTHAPIPEVLREICLGPDEAYVYDARVPNSRRGSGVFRSLLETLAVELRRGGVHRAYFYVRGDNVIGYRKAAAWAGPAGRIAYVGWRVGRNAVVTFGGIVPGGPGRRGAKLVPFVRAPRTQQAGEWLSAGSDNWNGGSPLESAARGLSSVRPPR